MQTGMQTAHLSCHTKQWQPGAKASINTCLSTQFSNQCHNLHQLHRGASMTVPKPVRHTNHHATLLQCTSKGPEHLALNAKNLPARFAPLSAATVHDMRLRTAQLAVSSRPDTGTARCSHGRRSYAGNAYQTKLNCVTTMTHASL